MRKAATILIYIALPGFVMTSIVNMLHMRQFGAIIMIVSCISLLAGCIISLFAPGKTSVSVYSPGYGSSKASNIVAYLGVIIFITGVLFKINHLSGGEYMVQAGLVTMLVFFLLVLYRVITYKKYKSPGPATINLPIEELEQYIGVYSNQKLKMVITVRKDGHSLEAQARGQNAFPLNPIEKYIFNYLKGGIVMEFRPEKKEFILIQKGGYFHFIKDE